MKKHTSLLPLLALAGLLWMLPSACTDENTDIGNALVDGSTNYHGLTATLTADRALSLRDDSLMTTGYTGYNTRGILGRYHDATFGSVCAELYTQVALPSNYSDIDFTQLTIDSVTLSLVKDRLYPDSSHTYNFHFEVMQLAEALQSDTLYYSNRTLEVDPGALFFDGDCAVGPTDTVICLRLNDAVGNMLHRTAGAAEFIQLTKGLRVRLTEAGDEGLLSLNFAATRTCLTVYYRYRAEDTVSSRYNFLLGTGTSRFTHYGHDYAGSVTGGADSLDGAQLLYLEPLAGYSAYLSFDSAVRAFAAVHPLAAVHNAELLLPVASGADGLRPLRILACHAGGSQAYISDLTDLYSLAGYGGTYDAASGCYRLRVTQHVQNMLRASSDQGTLLVLDSRQDRAERTILNGPLADNPVRIEFIYTE